MNPSKVLYLLVVFLISPVALAQGATKDIYANPENLKVLPEDISSSELSETMKGIAMGLGARCETCHVGEPDTPLTTFDFASDEKAMKRKARVMLKMVRKINEDFVPGLNEIEDSERVAVRCVTCHRGLQQPKLIQDVLDEQLAENGLDAALEKYAQLRESFYGSHSYDFSEYTLPMYAQGLAKKGKIEEAIALEKINADHFPGSYYTFFVLAELYKISGQTEPAIESYHTAINLNPGDRTFLEARIAELTSEAQ